MTPSLIATMKWPHFATNDRTTFGTSNFGGAPFDTAGNAALTLKKAGAYMYQLKVLWPYTGTLYWHGAHVISGDGAPGNWQLADSTPQEHPQPNTAAFAGDDNWDVGFQTYQVGGEYMTAAVYNFDNASAHTLTRAVWCVVYLGPSDVPVQVF